MGKDKRTPLQLDFDMRKHGWVFCNDAMLRGKIVDCEALALKLHPNDHRHAVLIAMRLKLENLTEKP